MKSKHWLSIFFILFLAGMLGYMGLNYYVDPLDYFAAKKNTAEYNSNNYTRAVKAEYIKENSDQYDAVLLGGSKCGVWDMELLSEYTGKRYYNFYFNKGNFSDYLIYTQYLIDNTDISELTLHLSSFEVKSYTSGDPSNVYEVPAIVSGNKWDQFTEFLSYLMTDTTTLKKGINAMGKTPSVSNSLETGERFWNKIQSMFEKDPEATIRSQVTKKLDSYLKKLFRQAAESAPAFDDNIAALRQIKTLCDENNVTLKVVIGASFIGERNIYECSRYYTYLRQIVAITDVWDFSDFSEVNMNPYNFYNRKHYTNAVGDLMVNTMYGGESREDFGIYLTQDNIDEYLQQRKADYERLKQEFETAGTLTLPGMEDDSYIQ